MKTTVGELVNLLQCYTDFDEVVLQIQCDSTDGYCLDERVNVGYITTDDGKGYVTITNLMDI